MSLQATALPKDLMLVDRAKQSLAEATTIDEIKDIIDKAEALRLYMRKATDGLDIQNQAAEIKLRAERRAGELLRDMDRERRGGDRRSNSKSQNATLKLSDLGVNKSQSSRWQQIASIDEPDFEQFINKTVASDRELTSAAALKLARQKESQATTTETPAIKSHTPSIATDLDELVRGGTKFSCIYADPPWPYRNQGTRAATDNHYLTLSLDEITAFPVRELAADAAHLHLWTTNAHLPVAFPLIEAWGFEYKSCLVWVKPQMGIGNYWRVSHEFLLLGVRGGLSFNSHSHQSWLKVNRRQHSEKPEEFRELIEEVSPGPFLELFARKQVPGWTVWGNQVSLPN